MGVDTALDRGILDRVKPQLPDTPVFNFLRGLSKSELHGELSGAQALRGSVDAYIAWLRMTLQLTESLELSPAVGNGVARSTVTVSDSRGETTGDRPTLRKAILMILNEDKRIWAKREVMGELERRGWLPEGQTPDKQLTNRITEMAKRGEIRRHGPGRLSAPDVPSEAISTDEWVRDLN